MSDFYKIASTTEEGKEVSQIVRADFRASAKRMMLEEYGNVTDEKVDPEDLANGD